MGDDGIIIPKKEFLDKLFMRKSGLPILKVPFPDGSEQPYWNTFYQQITYNPIAVEDLKDEVDLDKQELKAICHKVNTAIDNQEDLSKIKFSSSPKVQKAILKVINQKRGYLGQMDVNAKSKLVWEFYEDTLAKLKSFGCKILRLDAFAYLHKTIGNSGIGNQNLLRKNAPRRFQIVNNQIFYFELKFLVLVIVIPKIQKWLIGQFANFFHFTRSIFIIISILK